MRDLSPPNRDQTCVPCIGRWILNHWTTREVPFDFLIQFQGKSELLVYQNPSYQSKTSTNDVTGVFIYIYQHTKDEITFHPACLLLPVVCLKVSSGVNVQTSRGILGGKQAHCRSCCTFLPIQEGHPRLHLHSGAGWGENRNTVRVSPWNLGMQLSKLSLRGIKLFRSGGRNPQDRL